MPLPLAPNGARSDDVTVDPHKPDNLSSFFFRANDCSLAWKGGNPLPTTPSDAAPANMAIGLAREKKPRPRARRRIDPARRARHRSLSSLAAVAGVGKAAPPPSRGPRRAGDVEDHGTTVPAARTNGQAAAAGSRQLSRRAVFSPAGAFLSSRPRQLRYVPALNASSSLWTRQAC